MTNLNIPNTKKLDTATIKFLVSSGIKIFWSNSNYEVIEDSAGKFLIHSKRDDDNIGLTRADGVTLTVNQKDFYIG